jgi:CubicO group peptidase (beta-lactamase class C family)
VNKKHESKSHTPKRSLLKGFSGVMSLHEGRKELFTHAAGHANISEAINNTTDTRFGMASGSKLFTAVGIMQLIERGHFTLDTTANSLLGKYKVDKRITIKQLLNHVSGIFDYCDEELITDYAMLWKDTPNYRMMRPEDYFPMIMDRPNKFTPGEKFSYSNSGYVVLAYIIEKTAGTSFSDYIQSKVLNKCGMKHSGYYRFDALPPNTACGYIYDKELRGYRSNIYSLPIAGSGDGGCYSNARDVALFWDALQSGRLLSKYMTSELLKPHVEHYGLGVWIARKYPDTYYIQGWDVGVSFESFHNWATKKTLTVFSNTGHDIGKIVSELLVKLS